MPVERHWERMNAPLRSRDRVVLICAGTAVVIVAVAVAIFYATKGPARTNAGCVVAVFAWTMGGASVRSCGPAAHVLCRTQGKVDRTIGRACLAQGFAADVRRPPPAG